MKRPDWIIWIKDKNECKKWLDGYIGRRVLVKTEDESSLSLRKTNHNLNFANWIMEKHKDEIPKLFQNEIFYDWVINIYYYAIYHVASVLMSKEGYKSKSHFATLCYLIYNPRHLKKSVDEKDIKFVAESLDKEDIETIGYSKDLRERASYNIHESFELQLAKNLQEQTINFVNKIRGILER